MRERDQRKTNELRDLGWNVIRVREAPLAALSDWDVEVSFNDAPHRLATAVLQKTQDMLGVEIPRMKERLTETKSLNVAAAIEHMKLRWADEELATFEGEQLKLFV